MASDSDKRVGERPGVNISDDPGGAATPGLKSLASVDNISGRCGVGQISLDRPRCLLEMSGGGGAWHMTIKVL